MKRHSALKSILVSTVCVSLLASTLFGIPGANAELATPTAGSSSAPLATEEIYCDSICPSIANSNGQLLNLSGQPGWTSADDQWCANHNSQTNPSVMASPAPLGASVPSGTCNVSYYPGDTSCAQVTAGFQRCQYKNSQVESYCEAYESAKMAGAGEDLVLLLDIAATATCGAACAAGSLTGGINPVLLNACQLGSTAASATEIIVTLSQKASPMGKIADAALASAGIAEGLAGYKNGGLFSGTTSSATKASNYAQVNKVCDTDDTCDGTDQTLDARTNSANQNSNTQAKNKKNACITAVMMAALTGVRYYNNGYGKRSKESSCNSIWGLQSSANAIAGGITAAGYNASGGSVASTSGSSISSTGTSAGTSPATGLNCMAGGGTVASCAGQSSAATDGGILSGGLGNAALPLAQQLANAGLPAALQSGGGLGAAMGGAMSGDGAMGAALTKVAQVAADNGKELGQAVAMGGYGGGGGGGSTASDSNGLANLFGNAGPTAVTAPMQVFKGDGEDADDIWHSRSSSNIFQIVSHRIGKVNP